jgi:hypothetical protein
MAKQEPAGDGITRRLQEAIDRLQEDVTRVEIWAGALSGFLKPVPSYETAEKHKLPPREPRAKAVTGARARPIPTPREDA